MTEPSQPDPERAAAFLGKLLRDDPSHLDVATDDEVEAMMDAAGVEAKEVPSAQDLVARAAARAARLAPVRPAPASPSLWPTPRSRARRMGPVSMAALAALGAMGVLALMNGEAIVAKIEGRPIGPVASSPTPAQRATALRDEAFAACDGKQWAACAHKLDEAKAIDPAGEAAPRVLAARKAVAEQTPKPQ